jgi:hypothetical protein
LGQARQFLVSSALARTANALYECKGYILLARRRNKTGQWVFSRSNGYPKFVIERKLKFTLKDQNDKYSNIHVDEFMCAMDNFINFVKKRGTKLGRRSAVATLASPSTPAPTLGQMSVARCGPT